MAGLFTNPRRAHPRLVDLVHRLEAGLMGLLWWLARRLSLPRASALGRHLFGVLGPRTRKQRWVLGNLRTAFPERSEAEIRRLARRVWENFGATALEYPHLRGIDCEAVEIVFSGNDAGRLRESGPWIFVGAHLGNIDLTAFAVRQLGIAADAVHSPLANPYLERRLQNWRQAPEVRFVPKERALRSLARSLRDGKSVGFVVDVRTDGAPLYPFFDIPAATTEAPAWLSWKFQRPVVPIQVVRVADGRFRVVFHPPLPCPGGEDEAGAIAALTTGMNRVIAGMIAEDPGQWWCGKRRWPRSAYRGSGDVSR